MVGHIGCVCTIAVLGVAMLPVSGCEEPARAPSVSAAPLPAGADMQNLARQIVLQGLTDRDPQIRANAIEVVAAARQVLMMPKVQKLLADEAVPVRFAAALAVGDLEYALAREDVAVLLNDPNPNAKIAACYAMVRLGYADYYKVISNAVASKDQTVRANAALLLGKSGRQEGIRFLYWTLQRDDSADMVILQAAESIAMLGDHRIYPKLWTRLISAYADDRVVGIQAMGALGTDEAKNALITMLDDGVPEVRLAAAEQLGKLGDPIGEPEVLEVFKKNVMAEMDAQGRERVKILAALAIGEVGTEPPAKYLPSLLQDASKRVRLAAARAVLRRTMKKAGS